MSFSSFAFEASDLSLDGGSARNIVKAYNDALVSLDDVFQQLLGTTNVMVHFEVVDVCLGATATDIASLEKKLIERIVAPAVPHSDTKIRRVLFVGSSAALDQWEDETDEVRSAKKQLELLIRMLQSNHLGHYSQVTDQSPAGRGNIPTSPAPDYIRSSILGLARYYGKAWGVREKDRPDQPLVVVAPQLVSWEENLEAMQDDICRVLNEVGKADIRLISPLHKIESVRECKDILLKINRLFQYGKRSDQRILYNEEAQFPTKARLNTALQDAHCDGEAIKELNIQLRQYELLRDAGRLLGSGAIRALRTESIKKAGHQRTKIVIFDERLYAHISKSRDGGPSSELRASLSALFHLIGWLSECHVADPAQLPAYSDFSSVLEQEQRVGTGLSCVPLADDVEPHADVRLEDARLILVEVDSVYRYVGPLAVRHVHNYLRRKTLGTLPPPPILVLTRTESSGHIQQALNLGASAYVLKERLFQLPFHMYRTLAAADEITMGPVSPSSGFRKLDALRPEIAAKLRKTDGHTLLRGGLVVNGKVFEDERERKWIHDLPKADLHCHLGTCVPLPAVGLLAANTVGYLLAGVQADRRSAFVQLFRGVNVAVAIGDWLRSRLPEVPPLMCLAVGAVCVTPGASLKVPQLGIGDFVVKTLKRLVADVEDFEVAAVLVAALFFRNKQDRDASTIYRKYFQYIVKVVNKTDCEARSGFSRAAMRHAMEVVGQKLRRTASRWKGYNTLRAVQSVLGTPQASDEMAIWNNIDAALCKRVDSAASMICAEVNSASHVLGRNGPEWQAAAERFSAAKHVLNDLGMTCDLDFLDGAQPLEPEQVLSLYDCVSLPESLGQIGRFGESGLQRYLWGADLLGAEHFQYPENVLLATYAFVRDNASDNVLYSEVRCETTGYCKAGMTAEDATELLCTGFDMASLAVVNEDSGMPLVRTNVLLAAKRHKPREAAHDAITLMEGYLQRRSSDPDRDYARRAYPADLPVWWRPCEVVGFDISGDESKTPKWMTKALRRLAVHSSAITIHAGEAASADSIWHAVYKLYAVRIGHGLRLREDLALLRYCVSEGICMEMCPNSNVFTNIYSVDDSGRYPEMNQDARIAYPLKLYLQQGLDVALGTDNRYLHGRGRQTLTSEYLTAARLSSGLTRWDALLLVKGGFKNAFLSKGEVKALVSAVEERVYEMISRGWF